MHLADRVDRIQSSKTVSITNTVLKMKQEGYDVISLGAGEPDFETPDFIKKAAIEAIQTGKTKYTQVMGIPELRKAIVEKFKRDNDLDYGIDRVVVTTGGKQALFNAVLAICQEGDEVLVPSPFWVSYPEQIQMAGATLVPVKALPENGFKIDPEDLKAAITPRTKLVIFNNPVNPTGAVYDFQTLEQIAKIVAEAHIWALTDEIYEKIVFDGVRHYSLAAFPEIKEQVVVVNGVSKAFAMTGWRIGFAAGSQEVISAMNKIQGHSTSNANTMAQWASVAALNSDWQNLQWMVDEFEKRRNFVVERLSAMPDVASVKPAGTFYIFPKVSSYFGKKYGKYEIRDSLSFCQFLLEEEKVALIPGEAFGADEFVRISFAASFADLEKGMNRIGQGLTKLYSL
ncbi:aspartate aminotransferase [bacterium BMS3Abin05]|nr:aspartate aminotransferase [bacterium BMS3Abin05]